VDGDACREQLFDDAGQHRAIAALSGEVGVGQAHAEQLVDLVEVTLGLVDEQLPERERVGVLTLQQDDPPARAVGKSGSLSNRARASR